MLASRLRAMVHVTGRLSQQHLPVVCIPGYQRNMSDFTGFVQGFGRAWPLVLIDLPGRGRADRAVVYGHSFGARFARAVRDWAARRGVRLVSVGYRNDWADEQWLTAGPEEFARAMGEARAVVTNFFHGCVFALLNAKPFLCAPSDYRSNKLRALVGAVAAEPRLVEEADPQSTYDDALDTPLNPATSQRIAALRERSTAYLDHALA